jgi:hypothetical protein
MRSLKKTAAAFRLVAIAATLLIALVAQVPAQPGGGKTAETSPKTPTTSNPKPAEKSPAKTTPKVSTKTKPASSAIGSIAGKWWTSGNGFGDSEVVFTQNGANVSGVIRYADGRTGAINGTMAGLRLKHTWTNSSGDGGTGWLELSWNNFLGGPWQNQKVRDGSWTMMRIEGKWCFGGSRTRIRTVTHNGRGEVESIAEDGTRTGGRMEGPWIYLESDGMTIKGEMDFRANRMNWSSGFFWSWCGRD